MNASELQKLYSDLLEEYFPHKNYLVRAEFYSSASIRHTVTLKNKTIHLRIAQVLRSAPREVLSVLGLILLGKLFRYQIDRRLRRYYNAYLQENILPQFSPQTRRPSTRYHSQGAHFDLQEIFDRVNALYFSSSVKKPLLGWSLQKAYTRLGFYSAEKNLLVISRIFDSPKTPPEVLDYMMFHEMLHIALPVEKINGRRRIHTAEFKNKEAAFPGYARIQKWIKRNRFKL